MYCAGPPKPTNYHTTGTVPNSGQIFDGSNFFASIEFPYQASERAMLSQLDAYVGGDGGWASGEADPDEDDYPSSGGSNGEDFGADDY